MGDTSSADTLKLSEIHLHPSDNKTSQDYDYALINLSGNSSKKPIELNSSEVKIPNERQETTMGWGAMKEDESGSSTLRKVNLPLVTKSKCDLSYKKSITSRMICAGLEKGGKDSFQGDSGGPLIHLDKKNIQRLIGLVSWGEVCARPKKYGFYAKFNSVISWIASKTK